MILLKLGQNLRRTASARVQAQLDESTQNEWARSTSKKLFMCAIVHGAVLIAVSFGIVLLLMRG